MTSSPPPRPSIPRELAHELRSPLAALIGVIDLVTDPGTPLEPEETAELLAAARADAVQLLALVERARAPREAAEEPVVLVDVVVRAAARFPDLAGRLFYTPDRSVVSAAEGAAVDQIVTNLFQNVSRYAPEGPVRVRLARESDAAVLECSDEGPGIPAEDRESVFRAGRSLDGLHIGLRTSRELARAMGGDLTVVDGPTAGATFRLVLPASREPAPVDPVERAVAPRARLLLDVAHALEASSPREAASLVAHLVTTVLGAHHARVLLEGPDGFVPLDDPSLPPVPAGELPDSGSVVVLPPDVDWPVLAGDRCAHRSLVPVPGARDRAYLLVCSDDTPWTADDPVLSAAALLAGLAVARLGAERDLDTERSLRATVMEALPIAISIFEGDPPRLVDWNAAELDLLGLPDPSLRPADLDASQRRFDVRFEDGRPLTAENAPVVEAIRSGRRSGPFILRIRRLDGTEVRARTYCSPIVVDGAVTGAVVTSEKLEDPSG